MHYRHNSNTFILLSRLEDRKHKSIPKYKVKGIQPNVLAAQHTISFKRKLSKDILHCRAFIGNGWFHILIFTTRLVWANNKNTKNSIKWTSKHGDSMHSAIRSFALPNQSKRQSYRKAAIFERNTGQNGMKTVSILWNIRYTYGAHRYFLVVSRSSS